MASFLVGFFIPYTLEHEHDIMSDAAPVPIVNNLLITFLK